MLCIVLLLGQVPDPSVVIKEATSSSWEAGMLAIIIVVFMSAVIYMIKRQTDQHIRDKVEGAKRESRMAERVNLLEDEIRKVEREHSLRILEMTERVTNAILKSTESQVTLQDSVKELCAVMRGSPCVAIRGGYRLVAPDGSVAAGYESMSEPHILAGKTTQP